MLATLGCIAPDLTGKLPGYLSPSMGMQVQLIAHDGCCELAGPMTLTANTDYAESISGDHGFKVLTVPACGRVPMIVHDYCELDGPMSRAATQLCMSEQCCWHAACTHVACALLPACCCTGARCTLHMHSS